MRCALWLSVHIAEHTLGPEKGVGTCFLTQGKAERNLFKASTLTI